MEISMNKLIIVINGSGGVGKDTICGIVGKHYKTMNVSSIDPIKKIAYENGWKGEKSAKARKFLAGLKQVFIDYNDLPQKYLMRCCREFWESDDEIMFVHIREPREIEKFKNNCSGECATLLIRGRNNAKKNWNNVADDYVENYNYDFCYENNKRFKELESDFLKFFERMLKARDSVK